MAVLEGTDPREKLAKTYKPVLTKNFMVWPFVQAANCKLDASEAVWSSLANYRDCSQVYSTGSSCACSERCVPGLELLSFDDVCIGGQRYLYGPCT